MSSPEPVRCQYCGELNPAAAIQCVCGELLNKTPAAPASTNETGLMVSSTPAPVVPSAPVKQPLTERQKKETAAGAGYGLMVGLLAFGFFVVFGCVALLIPVIGVYVAILSWISAVAAPVAMSLGGATWFYRMAAPKTPQLPKS